MAGSARDAEKKKYTEQLKMHPVLLEEGSPNAFRVWGGGKVGRKRRGRVFWLVLFVRQARMYMLEDVGHGIVVLMCVVPGWVDVDGERCLRVKYGCCLRGAGCCCGVQVQPAMAQ